MTARRHTEPWRNIPCDLANYALSFRKISPADMSDVPFQGEPLITRDIRQIPGSCRVSSTAHTNINYSGTPINAAVL
jgi:hypothetical protein